VTVSRRDLRQWFGGAVMGVIVTEGTRFLSERLAQWHQKFGWLDPLVSSLLLGWTLPAVFTYLFYRNYIFDGRAEPALMRIWFGGMTVMFLGVAYFEVMTGSAESYLNSLKDDPITTHVLLFGTIFGILHSMFRAVLTGDGAERRRRRPKVTKDPLERTMPPEGTNAKLGD
jgi:hypothetical protein